MFVCVMPFTDINNVVRMPGEILGSYSDEYVEKLVFLGFANRVDEEFIIDDSEPEVGSEFDVEHEEEDEESIDDDCSDENPSIDKMTMVELKELAASRGVAVVKGWKRTDLIKALKG